MGSDMHSVPKLPICYTVLWQILRVHLCITDLELMDQNSNYKKNNCSHLPLVVFGHADTLGCMCQVFRYIRLGNLPLPQYNREPK